VRWPSFTRGVHGRFKFNFHQEANSMTGNWTFFSSTLLSRFRSVYSCLSPIPPGCLSTIRFTLSPQFVLDSFSSFFGSIGLLVVIIALLVRNALILSNIIGLA
jgi:hypothetical protein